MFADGLQIRMLKLDDLTSVVEDSFANMESDYGNKLYHFHRVDLHSQLRELAEAPESVSSPGKPVKIHLSFEINNVDRVNGSLTLRNGTVVKKDLLVVADGIKVCPFLVNTAESLSNHTEHSLILYPLSREWRKLW